MLTAKLTWWPASLSKSQQGMTYGADRAIGPPHFLSRKSAMAAANEIVITGFPLWERVLLAGASRADPFCRNFVPFCRREEV